MRTLAANLLFAMTLVSQPAAAACLGSGDPQVDPLVQEIGRHPGRALAQIEQALAQTPDDAHRRRAWLHGARSAAMGMLGQQDEQVSAAVKHAEATLPADDAALLYLRLAELAVTAQAGQVRAPAEALRAALSRQPPRAESTVCATALLAYVLYTNEHTELAFPVAAEAYRNSAGGTMRWPHAEAASTLAQVTRFQSDTEYAVALNTEALAYFTEAGMHDMVANELAMRGWARMKTKSSQETALAEADLRGSAEAARRADNEIAVGYAYSGLCEVLVAARRLEEARPFCEDGYQIFVASTDQGAFGMKVNYAAYLLETGRPAETLKLLDAVLADGRLLPQNIYSYMGRELRGRAYAALGDHQRAFTETQAAIGLLKQVEARGRARSAVVTRARFQTDQLVFSLARKTQEHEESMRRGWLIGIASLVVMLLLAVIVYVMARHRRFYRRMAFTDVLTGVPNRRYTEARVLEMLAHAQARRTMMTLSLLDLDHFKGCNDRYGHDAGDEALRSFAATVEQMIRPGDVFGRWGGEEFLLALGDTDEASTRNILGRIRIAAAQTRLRMAPDYALRFSAGTISAGMTQESLSELLGAADRALYRAKSQGRNQDFFAHSTAEA